MTASNVYADSIGKAFGPRTALSDVTLLAEGGITALLGPNGCGKSTLLRTIATVIVPDTGAITIDGLDPRREQERTEARRRLGYAPQEAGFDDRLRVFDAVDYVGVLKGIGETRRRRRSVFEALDRVGLASRVGERVGELSGGMKRRLVLAQALLGSPSLLVFDEPGAGLDPDERLRLRTVLAERRRTTTVLLATHLTDEAAVADTVIVLAAGSVRFAGTPAQPRHTRPVGCGGNRASRHQESAPAGSRPTVAIDVSGIRLRTPRSWCRPSRRATWWFRIALSQAPDVCRAGVKDRRSCFGRPPWRGTWPRLRAARVHRRRRSHPCSRHRH